MTGSTGTSPINLKYAILIIPPNAYSVAKDPNFEFRPGLQALEEPIAKTFEKAEIDHWPQWMGSLEWDRWAKETFQVRAWMGTETPEVLDGENKYLTELLQDVYSAYTLTAPFSTGAGPAILTGTAVEEGEQLRPMSIRQVTRLEPWFRSSFMATREYHQGMAERAKNQTRFSEWNTIFGQIEAARPKQKDLLILKLALLFFQKGLQEPMLDFRIPNFIRAAEAVLALKKNQGAAIFASRALAILPPQTEWLFTIPASEVEIMLRQLYQVRSDCVHGKPFAWTLRKDFGPDAEAKIPQYDYLAETLARHAIRFAFASPKFFEHVKERDLLEEAWDKKILP